MAEPATPLVALDGNVLDPGKDTLEPILALARAGRIALGLPAGVRAEIDHPATPGTVRALLPTLPPLPAGRAASSHEAKLRTIRVRAILRGDAEHGRHEADAAHLCEAAAAGCDYFVTGDRRVLRRRDELRLALPPTLRIVSPERLLAALSAPGEA